MSIERSGVNSFPPFSPSPLPEHLVTGFIDGSLVKDAEPDKVVPNASKFWRLHETPVKIPGVEGDTRLRVEYRKVDIKGEHPEQFDQMRFDYVLIDGDGKAEPIAEMYWLIPSPNTEQSPDEPYDLMLSHREVKEKFQGRKGIGTFLYQQAEAWAQSVATATHKPLTLSAALQQRDVFDWMRTKCGYGPYDSNKRLFDELVNEPDHFESTTLDYGINNRGDHIVRHNVMFRKGEKAPVRLQLKKVLNP